MEQTSTKMRRTMRDLHNKIGFFIVGLVVIYALSGIVQTYRDTSLLKHEVKRVTLKICSISVCALI